jgi:alpha-ketoglutarate-dependent taurine dioxygenase
MFCCDKPAEQGGETPVVDSRRVYERIAPEIREQFVRKGVMYIRNYGRGLGLSWQEVFRTTDRAEVESRCRAEQTEFEWIADGNLKTRSVRPAVVRHPRTGEWTWFNQAQHWHVSCLDAVTRASLRALFSEEDLPRNCYYGDGTRIEDFAMEHILEIYQQLEVSFPWRHADILLLDNLLTAHARNRFDGERRLLVAMGDMLGYANVVAAREAASPAKISTRV